MNEYLNQIEISGVTYDLIASGGTDCSGVTSGQVQQMMETYTYDKLTIDRKIASGGTFDPEDYYDKNDIDNMMTEVNDKINEASGDTEVLSGDVINLEESVNNAFIEIKNVKLALSGAIDDKQDKLVAGENIIISGNVISATMSGGSGVTSAQVQTMIDQSVSGKSNSSDVYLKTETSGKTQLSTAFSNKQDTLIAGSGITISGNVISANVSGGSGVTSGQVQTMINKSISGKVDVEDNITRLSYVVQSGNELHCSIYKGNEGSPSGDAPVLVFRDGFRLNGWYLSLDDSYVQQKLTAGDGISINGFNTISVSGKQDTLSAGTGIDITNNVISVTGGGESSGITSGEVQTLIDQSISGKVKEVKSSYGRLANGGSGYSVNTKYSEAKTATAPIFEIGEGLKNTPDVTYSSINKLSVDMDYINANISGGSGVTSAQVQSMMENYTYDKEYIDNLSISGGSGVTYSAGTGIDITDRVISSTLNAYNGTGSGTLLIGDTRNTASTDFAVAIGVHNEALGVRSLAQGLSGKTTNTGESTFGQLNDTKHEYEGFGHSGNTVFTIGNGAGVDGSTTNYARHNAFEVRSNGDIYIPEPSKVTPNHYYQAPMIKLQDRLAQIDNKPNIWCGSESQWSQISGSTQSGTLYLIY